MQIADSQVEMNVVGFITNTLFVTLPILTAGLILLGKIKPVDIISIKT